MKNNEKQKVNLEDFHHSESDGDPVLPSSSAASGDHAGLKKPQPQLIWFTGLSGAGKTTIAQAVEQSLNRQGRHTILLDGDTMRAGLCKDLGFSRADRIENLRRVVEVARMMLDAELMVLAAFISPFLDERQRIRRFFELGEYIEVFVDAPLELCEQRDPKGLYLKARAGKIPDFTGISSPYEIPDNPELHLETGLLRPEQCVTRVLSAIGEGPPGYVYEATSNVCGTS